MEHLVRVTLSFWTSTTREKPSLTLTVPLIPYSFLVVSEGAMYSESEALMMHSRRFEKVRSPINGGSG